MTKLENAKEYVAQRLAERVRKADVKTFYEFMSEIEEMEDTHLVSVLPNGEEHPAYCLTCNMCKHVYGDCEEEKEELIESKGYENYKEQEICRKRFLDFYNEE